MVRRDPRPDLAMEIANRLLSDHAQDLFGRQRDSRPRVFRDGVQTTDGPLRPWRIRWNRDSPREQAPEEGRDVVETGRIQQEHPIALADAMRLQKTRNRPGAGFELPVRELPLVALAVFQVAICQCGRARPPARRPIRWTSVLMPLVLLPDTRLVKPGVAAPRAKQIVRCTRLDQSSVVKDEHTIGALDRGQTVRDNDRRAVLHQIRQRISHQGFGRLVQRARRLVENQNRGILDDRPGDCETLTLSTRECHTAHPEHRIEAFG